MGIHAGHLETALMMFLEPDLVAEDLPAASVPVWLSENEHVRFGGPVSFGWTSDDFTGPGHIGDPSGATAEIGGAVFESTIGYLRSALDEIASFEL